MTRRPTLLALLATVLSVAWAQLPLTPPTYLLSSGTELVVDVPVRGELTAASGQNFKDGSRLDVLVLRSAGDETVEVRVESDDFDTYATLVAPDGTILDANDEAAGGAFYASRVRAYLPSAGTYLVVVSGFGPDDLGAYTATRVAYAPPPKVVVDIDLPGRYEGFLNEEAADMLWVTVEAPTTVRATLRSFDFDAVLEVYDDNGFYLDANDDFDGTDSQLVLDLEPGRYEFLAKGYWEAASGAYTFEVEVYERPEPVVVDVMAPGTFEGYLEPQMIDMYRVTLSAPATVTVDLRSLDFDAMLEAYEEADGTAYYLDGNDDFGEGTDSRLVLALPAGTYLFDAAGFWDGASGRYTIDFAW
ncbi:MAG: hypothetical protein P1P87_17150 [Trueperaceae bacterium]|nr:hypothetical protein [Trueperaceae bacterium]